MREGKGDLLFAEVPDCNAAGAATAARSERIESLENGKGVLQVRDHLVILVTVKHLQHHLEQQHFPSFFRFATILLSSSPSNTFSTISAWNIAPVGTRSCVRGFRAVPRLRSIVFSVFTSKSGIPSSMRRFHVFRYSSVKCASRTVRRDAPESARMFMCAPNTGQTTQVR